MMMYIR